jgi:hypothetical protein
VSASRKNASPLPAINTDASRAASFQTVLLPLRAVIMSSLNMMQTDACSTAVIYNAVPVSRILVLKDLSASLQTLIKDTHAIRLFIRASCSALLEHTVNKLPLELNASLINLQWDVSESTAME